MSSVTGRAFDFPVLKRVFGFVRPYHGLFRLTALLTILLAILGPIRPWITQHMLDSTIAGNDFHGLVVMTCLLTAVLMVQSALQYYHGHRTSLLGQKVVRDMRVRLYGHILGFPVSWFDKTPIGTPVTRTISDLETIADIFSDGILVIIGDILQLVAIIGFMFYINWELALASLATIPLLIIATNVFKNNIKRTFNDVRTQVAALNVFVQEHLTGMKVVQVFNREEQESKSFSDINKLHRQANIKSVWYYSIFFPIVEILSAISIGLMIWWGAGDVIKGTASFGTLVAFIMYINLLFRPIRELADKFNTLQMGMVSAERIFRVLDLPSGQSDSGRLDASGIRGEVEFRNVWFAYNEEDWVLRDVSFKVASGETVAFVGATGAGKSTIINLINRFYESNKGEILIDGISIKEYDTDSLRRRIAVVLQDVFLFSDTIEQNITLGNKSISMDEISNAAVAVGADRFIDKLPGKFQYQAGERGALISMGQRQLISFIRAYVHKPAVLVLDEATSSIDSESEALITRATRVLTAGRTSLVIAHRLSTVQDANRIIVLDHGEIRETGTHQELLELGRLYYQLYRIQFGQVTS